jgi:membrane protein implicated in regulation of membrane protease activity
MFMAAFYFLCLLVGLIYAVAATLMGGFHVGGDGHDLQFGGHDGDFGGHDGDTGGGGGGGEGDMSTGEIHFSPLSPIVITTFLTAFGAMGLISLYALGVGKLLSVAFAILLALLIAGAVFAAFTKIFAVTQSSSEAHQSEMVGTDGEVITPIGRDGLGEVAYVQRGSRYTAPARSIDGKPVARGTMVRIVRLVGNTVIVDPER